jgi:hypothetical protein
MEPLKIFSATQHRNSRPISVAFMLTPSTTVRMPILRTFKDYLQKNKINEELRSFLII